MYDDHTYITLLVDDVFVLFCHLCIYTRTVYPSNMYMLHIRFKDLANSTVAIIFKAFTSETALVQTSLMPIDWLGYVNTDHLIVRSFFL